MLGISVLLFRWVLETWRMQFLLYLQNVLTTPNDTTTSKASIKFSGVKKKFAHITLPPHLYLIKLLACFTISRIINSINFETKLLGKTGSHSDLAQPISSSLSPRVSISKKFEKNIHESVD